MGFFDLNIPYLEGTASDKSMPDKLARKAVRLKLCTKAMELGYTGVAYNRCSRGVMSNSDCCSIPLLSLSSLLKLAPSLAASVKFHRQLLGLPTSTPFRQYTRLTVSVESSAQAAVLNSSNSILKTYDLVAVRPLSQNAFEHACLASEVDIIAIDFSEKLPFRLKLPLVKAAIKRGVYFEITYANLIGDVQTRRQVISNAKLLVDWTRGKNVIFSSAAPSVNELRGPYDVANLSSLLGLSMEHAKAALSKNCRSLIANALRKKQYYKEAIRVELISSAEQSDSKEPSFGDWLKWDPISSGEGDLQLDDIAKFFSASSKVSKSMKAIDFASVVDSQKSHGLQVKDAMPGALPVSQSLGNNKSLLSTAEELDKFSGTNAVCEQSDQLNLQPERDHASLLSTVSRHQTYGFDEYQKSFLFSNSPKLLTDAVQFCTNSVITVDEPHYSNGLQVHTAPVGTELDDMQGISSDKTTVALPDGTVITPASPRDIEVDAACNADTKTYFSTPSMDGNLLAFEDEEFKKSENFYVDSSSQNVAMDEVLTEADKNNQADLSLVPHDLLVLQNPLEREQPAATRDNHAVLQTGGVLLMESCDEMEGDPSIANPHSAKVLNTANDNPTSEKHISGKCRVKRRTPHQAVLFPFRRLLNPTQFKKKTRNLKNGMIMG
ncbi:protein GAMETOPHYTE DEFECTIVE 1 [Malania oleifera]|uniref:protein GAMETOPHYTE DEFECTIVE 1 n=1 Tax=Malania oleifera TaxID=397392 RepID=UPI0025AE255E|nr:protein GAMETOPHYTE DEFECTIVE 1 [Malania oleifera]